MHGAPADIVPAHKLPGPSSHRLVACDSLAGLKVIGHIDRQIVRKTKEKGTGSRSPFSKSGRLARRINSSCGRSWVSASLRVFSKKANKAWLWSSYNLSSSVGTGIRFEL